MAVWPKSDSRRADLGGCKAIALTFTALTLCHRIHLPQQQNRCGGSLEFQIAIQQSSDISSVGLMTAHFAGLAGRVLAKPVKHFILRGDRM